MQKQDMFQKRLFPATKGYFDEKVAIIGAGPAGISCILPCRERLY